MDVARLGKALRMNDRPVHDPSRNHRYLVPNEELPFPAKLNVHFPLRGALYDAAVRANRLVQTITTSEIDLSPQSFQVPHITVCMAFVEALPNLVRVMEVTQSFAAFWQPTRIHITAPYLKGPKRTWAFIDIVEREELIALKREFFAEVRPWITPLSWDVVQEPPHITVGYIKERFDEVASVLKTADFVPQAEYPLDALELSFGGIRGSCLGSIRTFELTVEPAIRLTEAAQSNLQGFNRR